MMGIGLINAQQSTLVTVSGRVLSAKDSSAQSTSILYEKLPYYDDMGLASANGEGIFNFQLLASETYIVSVRKDGFLPLSQEVKFSQSNDNFILYLESNPEEEVITLQNVIFARGSDVLQQESFDELDMLHDRLKENNNLVIQLEGHTDFAGNPQANLALSQARVDAVKKYLTRGGVDSDRVLTKAFGGTQPLFQERTMEAMAKNRRVEVRIIKK
jgi:outer membrane protein OmpA-like peptidoglycan-associated protein